MPNSTDSQGQMIRYTKVILYGDQDLLGCKIIVMYYGIPRSLSKVHQDHQARYT